MISLRKLKLILVVAITISSSYIAIGNIFMSKYVEVYTYAEKFFQFTPKIKLGLDISGGSQLLLAVDFDKFLQERYEVIASEINDELYIGHIKKDHILLAKQNGIAITNALVDVVSSEKINKILSNIDVNLQFVQSNGVNIIKYSDNASLLMQNHILDRSMKIIRSRIDSVGTKEISIQRSGVDKIILEVPGLKNPDHVKKALGRTAKLSFHLMDHVQPFSLQPYSYIDDSKMILSNFNESVKGYYSVKKIAELTGESILDARVSLDNFKVSIVFKLNNVGAKKFAEITSQNVGHPFAIVLDGKVLTSPVISEPIFGGSGVISGHFSHEEASDLANMIRSGALPAPIKVAAERVVGPSLGRDAISHAAMAFCCGIGLIFIFMTFFYKILGIVANIAIIINFTMAIAIMALLNITLTLPGIAGLILTLGMAVDANVLIYERIKDDIDHNIGSAVNIIRRGFKDSLSAIMDSNITTILSAISLMAVTTGFVRGFSVSLIVGILCSLFTTIVVSSLMLEMLASSTKMLFIGINAKHKMKNRIAN